MRAAAIGAAAAGLSPTAAQAAFPGANGRIAYAHQVDQTSSAIYSVSPSGGSPTNLSAVGAGTTMTADFQPAWSANGRLLSFVRVDFANCSGQIWVMKANGTGQTDLSNDAATANEFNPAFGPNGGIVFVRAAAGTFNICSPAPVNAGNLWVATPGGTPRQLTTDGHDNTPAWSPDGKRIAFTRVGAGGPHIFVMNADGTGTPTDLGPGLKPNWSPDGKKIVFAAPGMSGPSGGPVTVMNANGTGRTTLNAGGTAPAFSPNGKQITYVAFSATSQSSVIGVMNANGTGQHNITSPGAGNSDVKPDWQPVIRVLHLAVTPSSSRAGTRTCYRFRTTSGGKAVAGATLTFAGHHGTTSATGRLQVCAKLSVGRYHASATKAGYSKATAAVRVRRRKRTAPGFTG